MIKMKKFLVWCLIAVVQASAMIAPINAYAQTTQAYTGLAALNQIIQGAYTAAATSTAGITNATAAAAEYATLANGMRVPIATTAAAAVSSGRLAGLAAGAMKAGTGIGLASIILPILWDKSGLKVCPPPQFICKATEEPKSTPVGLWYSQNTTYPAGGFANGQAVCNARGTAVGQTLTYFPDASGTTGTCKNPSGTIYDYPATNGVGSCPVGTTAINSICRSDTKTANIVAADISTPLQTEMNASAVKQQQVYDVIRSAGLPNVIQGGDTATVTAPSVQTQPVKTTETISNPDGSTSTKVVSTVTNITPVVTGTTVNNINITYPTTSTTTTTITNNTTQAQTTDQQTKTETATAPDKPAPPQPKPVADPVTDFCVTNPTLNVCKNSTVSGTCKEITCTGDAISCAVAQQVAEANCRAVKDVQDIQARKEYALGNTVLAGGPDPLAGVPTKENGTTVNASTIDQSGWLGGGACFPDKSFSIQGKTVTIPFKAVCEYMIVFRMAVMMVGLIGAARILAGAVIRE